MSRRTGIRSPILQCDVSSLWFKSGDGEVWRGARRSKEQRCARKDDGAGRYREALGLWREITDFGLPGMSPGHAYDCAARTALAAAGILPNRLLFFQSGKIVAVMNILAEAACVRARRDCRGERSEISDECDEQ